MATAREQTPVEDSERAATLALRWLSTERAPRFICSLEPGTGTAELAVIWANEAAFDAAERGRELEIVDGSLQMRDRLGQEALLALAGAATEALSSFCFPCEDRGDHLLFRAQRIGLEGRHSFIGLTVLRTGNEFQAPYCDLDKAFQLTPAEDRVLHWLIDGYTADQIAETAKLSIETVRSHIRHLYAKMNVTSREALLAKTRAFHP